MTPRPRPVSEGAGQAGRVILHLYALGRLGPDEIAEAGFTQKGMVEATRLRQSALTNVLARLRASGAVVVDRRHVSGEARRMNVYRLTALGEAVARDLRRRQETVGDLRRAASATRREREVDAPEAIDVPPFTRPGR